MWSTRRLNDMDPSPWAATYGVDATGYPRRW